jgi:HEAT repeat protein
MQILSRNLTAEESAIHARLKTTMDEYGTNFLAPRRMRELAQGDPAAFFTAALWLLHSEPDSAGRRHLYQLLLDSPEFLPQLTNPELFSIPEALELCLKLMRIDPLLDVKIARMMPGRADAALLSTPQVLRTLDILSEISPGTRLIPILGHLTHHGNRRISSKAALLLGRRIRNREWVERHLTAQDARIRANVIEALWGLDAPYARKIMQECVQDNHNRVAGNALFGLHLLGHKDVCRHLQDMMKDPRAEFRSTAAWVMGKAGSREFMDPLLKLAEDQVEGVRRTAQQALASIGASGSEPAAESLPSLAESQRI